MGENVFSSLPVEYQLNYGTARGDLDLLQFVNKSPINGIWGVDGCLSQEELLRLFGIDPRSLLINGRDSLLVGSKGL